MVSHDEKANATLLVGLGNPILGDDAAGWRVVERLQEEGLPEGVEAVCLAAGGLRLMETMLGYAHVVVVDAFDTPEHPAGTVFTCPIEAVPAPDAGHLNSSHDTSLPHALEMARRLGFPVPRRIDVVGIAARVTLRLSEELTPAIESAIPQAQETVRRLL
ncbi:MAG: hydrogenase maturation protease [Anaerolineae bacterium]|nr:MAG: hydrogenase maturation protease [Anaerolineae bacterium]